MSLRAIPAPVWFVAALVPMVVSQIVRLEQSDAATWIFWDYAGRLGALAVLGAIPSARTVAFRAKRLRMSRWEAGIWVVGIVLVDHYLCGWIRRTINTALPATVLGSYPEAHGWLHIVDAVFGLALVAYSEEIVFRRCARHLFQIYLNDGFAMVVVTSILFGAYHWWTGIGNIIEAVLIGILLMLFYRLCSALAGCARTLRDRYRRLCVMSAWKASATGVQIANLPFDRNADPFTVVIRCASGNGVDNKTEDGCDVLGWNHGF